MATKYDWTDWITHVPGQELPAGFYGRFEFQGSTRNGGLPYVKEGGITPAMKGNLVWRATYPGEFNVCLLRRYQLRIDLEEAETLADAKIAELV